MRRAIAAGRYAVSLSLFREPARLPSKMRTHVETPSQTKIPGIISTFPTGCRKGNNCIPVPTAQPSQHPSAL